MKIKDRMLTPRCKWSYCQFETGVWIERASFSELCESVLDHRRSNGLERATEGDVEQDVEQQICSRTNAAYCMGGEFDAAQLTAASVYHATAALAKTLTQDSLVSPEEAERRADLCKRCYHNRPYSGCFGSCIESFKNLYHAMIGDKTTKNDDKLATCEVCGCSCKTIVHFNLKVLNSSINPERRKFYEKTGFCWRK